MAKLNRALTLPGLTLITIGSCIGSGIFITPANTLDILRNQGWVLLLWGLGGIITFFGAITFAELGSRYPGAGGVYLYIKHGFGHLPAFLYGWVTLFIVNTGAIAALCVALVDYLQYFFTMTPALRYGVAVSVIVILTFINVIGIRSSQYFASLFTALKLLAIFFIIVVGFIFLNTKTPDLQWVAFTDVPDNIFSLGLMAFVGVFWSFGGWHHATYLAAETIEPQRTVPRAILIGTLTVTLTYILVIAAIMFMVPMAEMVVSERIAGDALSRIFSKGGKWVSIFIAISIFGTIGIYTMSAPRIYFSMARDGVFFPFLAKIHPVYKTPAISMIFQSLWAIVLIFLWGSFIRIITFVIFMDILFMALATASIFFIRKKYGNDALFKVPLYPVIPIIYLIITVAFVINTALHLPVESMAGLFILALGFPFYYFYKRKHKPKEALKH